jgi:hypothetical protein
MINRSKVNDPRMWKKWRASGAVGTIEDAVARQLANQGEKLIVYEIAKHYAGPGYGCSTLSIGERTAIEDSDWSVLEPVLFVLAPGHNYTLGQEFQKLPKGYKPFKEVFQ